MTDTTIILTTDSGKAPEVHAVLRAAFEPYRPLYAPRAYADTVRSAEVFRERILSTDTDVLIAERCAEITGTVSTKLLRPGELYFFSMAVKPDSAGKGTGYLLLEKIESIARERNCRAISLETCYFLSKAIGLYERFGFARTGKERDYGGSMVFEMRKDLSK